MNIEMTITCKYSCPLCGLHRTPIEVPARGTETVTAWMDATVAKISADHKRRSPRCTARTLKELMIPMTRTNHIGGPSVQ